MLSVIPRSVGDCGETRGLVQAGVSGSHGQCVPRVRARIVPVRYPPGCLPFSPCAILSLKSSSVLIRAMACPTAETAVTAG